MEPKPESPSEPEGRNSFSSWLAVSRTLFSAFHVEISVTAIIGLLGVVAILAGYKISEEHYVGKILQDIGSFLIAVFLVHLVYTVILINSIGKRHLEAIKTELGGFKSQVVKHSANVMRKLGSVAGTAVSRGVVEIYVKHDDYTRKHDFVSELPHSNRVRSVARTFVKLWRNNERQERIAAALHDGMASFEFAMLTVSADESLSNLVAATPQEFQLAAIAFREICQKYVDCCREQESPEQKAGYLELRRHDLFLPFSTMEYFRETGDLPRSLYEDIFCEYFFDHDDKVVCGLSSRDEWGRKLRDRCQKIWDQSTPAVKLENGNVFVWSDEKEWRLYEGEIAELVLGGDIQ